MVSLALTKDFTEFERIGSLLPPEDKDAALFPRKINGKWILIHRPVTVSGEPGMHIWASSSKDLQHWENHRVLIPASCARRCLVGCEQGWFKCTAA